MLTYSTGLLENGWAFTGSVSRRWSQEGFVPGTFYDANQFLPVQRKKLLIKAIPLILQALSAMYKRGVGGGSVQEAYDLTGSNYYNPYWGFQDGGQRNSRVRSSNKPLLTLNIHGSREKIPTLKLRQGNGSVREDIQPLTGTMHPTQDLITGGNFHHTILLKPTRKG